jgi:NAD(P)-dependent dehydrogenase (short-subunit alcohol dehydrogenase family)
MARTDKQGTKDMFSLKGHTALITGSSKGVGRSIAESLAKAGCNIVIHGRSLTPDAQAAIDACTRHGVKVSFAASDLSGPIEPAVTSLFEAALKASPNIDLLVNNAGQYFDKPYLEMDADAFEKTMRLNVGSGYFLTQAFARRWHDNNINGRVLFIGSINGKLAEPVSTAYDISKGAIEMMVKTLAVALAPMNIRVNGLAPGLVRTPQTSWLDTRPADAAWAALHTPNGLVPHSDVCGPGAVYLLSDEADHVHGQMLLIDGGISALQFPHRPASFNG